MKIIKQSAVQDHCQDCIGGQNLSDHHTLLDESGTSTLLTPVRHNVVTSFTVLTTDFCSPSATNGNFFRSFLGKERERGKKGLVHFLEAIKKYLKILCCINYYELF